MSKVERFIDLKYLTTSKLGRAVLPLLAIVLVLVANYLVFVVVPNELVMGAVQRIFYFHVGAAMSTYVMVAVLFVASLFYLATKNQRWDYLAQAGAGVGFVFCTIVMGTGMIWGHSAWNTWWRWEPRLVSFLILWLIFFSYVLLRSFTQHDQRQANYAAVLGILAAINVPIVMFSIKLLSHAEQLHPEVVERLGLEDSSFVVALVVANFALIIFSLWLCWTKLTNILLREEITRLARIAQGRKTLRTVGGR